MKKLILTAILVAQSTFAYELDQSSLLTQCPFIQNDEFSFNDISQTIKAHLEKAITTNQECQAPLNALYGNVSQLNLLLSKNIKPQEYEKMSKDLKQKELLKLEIELLTLPTTDYRYSIIVTRIDSLRTEVLDLNINATYNDKYFQKSADNELMIDAAGRLNQAITAIQSMPPKCVDQIGGLKQVLPMMTAAASSLSGLDVFGGQMLVGAALNLISNLVSLLTDTNKKSALSELIKQNNSEILACTYFVNKNTACELKRARSYAQNAPQILLNLQGKFSAEATKDYDEFLYFSKLKEEYNSIFDSVASMGSAVTFDLKLISEYLSALRAEPSSIVIPSDDASDTIIQKWLIDVRARGIEFEEYNRDGKVDFKEQFIAAKLDVRAKVSTILTVGEILRTKQSFIDLKHELESKGELRKRTQKMLVYLNQKIMDPNIEDKGAIAGAVRVLKSLQEFLEVDYKTPGKNCDLAPMPVDYLGRNDDELGEAPPQEEIKDDYLCYFNKVNKKGLDMFEKMAEGTIAQIARQPVLAIASKIKDRVGRSFLIIEKNFLKKDLEDIPTIRFSDYKREKALEFQVSFNMSQFSGSSLTNRLDRYEKNKAALINGFGKEIIASVQSALDSKSEILKDLQGITAAHYCALYADMLPDSGWGRNGGLLSKCKKSFQELELTSTVAPQKVKIKWEDPCFYSDYARMENSAKILQLKQKDILGAK